VYTVSQSTGQGHETAFVRILREGLGLNDHRFDDRIRVHEGDPDLTVVGNGTGGSRSLYGAGSAVKLLAPRLIETAKPHAAAALGADVLSVAYRGGAFHSGGKSVGFFELSKKLAAQANSPHPMDCVAEGTFGATFPNGCHVAEVEIDPETGVVDVVNYATVDDIGAVVDHTSVEGQVHGGVLQGVGQALAEHAIYDRETGQLLAGSFMDYPMPRADWMRALVCDEHPVPTKSNALGAKGVGESGTSGALGATMNAILNAVRPAGVKDLDMPVTPDRLWRALREARNKAV
jgi:carbon-monoxide dehydrogenase large subunit